MTRRRGHEKILVIEDEELVRELCVRLLTRAGYDVTATGDGLEAWRIFESDPDAFDLLFVDVWVPGMGGNTLARRALIQRPKLPILFTSGLSFEQLHIDGVLKADVAFLAKPFKTETLLAMIRLLLDYKREAFGAQ